MRIRRVRDLHISEETKQKIRGLYNAMVAASTVLVCATCIVACSRPEKVLLGKWQSKPFHTKEGTKQIAFEFLGDGTVVYSRKLQASRGPQQGHWEPAATGTFRLINPTRLKMDWGWMSAMDTGPTIYEVDWRDSDHFKLQSGEGVTEFERVK